MFVSFSLILCVSFRTTFADGKFQTEVELLKRVNLNLSIKRNLSAAWYHSIPDIQIDAHLKPMSVSVCVCVCVRACLYEPVS